MKKILSILLLLSCTGVVFAQTVVYNQKSNIYHKPTCQSAKICKSCIKADKAVVIKKGARACKKCGG